jgi:hypothetical protein
VYRQATILLAGLAIDPANFLFSLQRLRAHTGGLPVTSECVPTQSNNVNGQAGSTNPAVSGPLCAGDLK